VCSSNSNIMVTGSMYSDINPLDHHTQPSHHVIDGLAYRAKNSPMTWSMDGYPASYDCIPKLTHL
jgi:hypothetical protein